MKKFYFRYGFWGMVKLSLNIIKTRLLYSKSRLIRFPFDIRNRHLIDLGQGLTTGIGCRIEAHPISMINKKKYIEFGCNVEINDYVHIAATESIKIGNNVLLASKIFISDLNHGCYSGLDIDDSSPNEIPNQRKLFSIPVSIGDNVWIGEGVSILAGVTIGKGSIIGANSVVTKSIPPNSIAVGMPARVIKKYDFKLNKWVKV